MPSFVSIALLRRVFGVWGEAGWALGQRIVSDPAIYARGTAGIMVGIMAAQIGNLFATRTTRGSALALDVGRNKWLFAGIAAQTALMLCLVYVPFLQPAFGTAALTRKDLLFLYMLAPAVFLMEEARKWLARWMGDVERAKLQNRQAVSQ